MSHFALARHYRCVIHAVVGAEMRFSLLPPLVSLTSMHFLRSPIAALPLILFCDYKGLKIDASNRTVRVRLFLVVTHPNTKHHLVYLHLTAEGGGSLVWHFSLDDFAFCDDVEFDNTLIHSHAKYPYLRVKEQSVLAVNLHTLSGNRYRVRLALHMAIACFLQ